MGIMLQANVIERQHYVQVELRIAAPRGSRSMRLLNAATFRVAAQIETLSADTEQNWAVEASVLRATVTIGLCQGDDPELAAELAREACVECGIEPAE